MSSSLQPHKPFAVKRSQDAEVLQILDKNVPGAHGRESGPILAAEPVYNGPARQEKLTDLAAANHKFVLEQRAHERHERMHPDQADQEMSGKVSNQHDDAANVDGIRNIN